MSDEKKIGIYKITNITNSKSYIGQSTNIDSRFKYHKTTRKKNMAISCAIFSLGVDNFTFDILKLCDKCDLDLYETKYIEEYDTISPNGYNLRPGGKYYNEMHADTKTKLSISKKGTKIGKDNHFYGKTHTLETREKISKANKGKTMSAESKELMSKNAHRMFGKDNPNFGKPAAFKGRLHTEEAKKKIGDAERGEKNHNCVAVVIDGVRYYSKRYAAEQLGIFIGTITNRCNNINFPTYIEEKKSI